MLGRLTVAVHDLRNLVTITWRFLCELHSGGLPLGPKMDSASLFTLKLDFEPFIETTVDRQRAEFDNVASDKITVTRIFVKDFYLHIISDILDVDFEELVVPLGSFTLILGSLGSDALHPGVANHVGIHLSEGFRVTSKTRFEDVYLQFSTSGHLLFFIIF